MNYLLCDQKIPSRPVNPIYTHGGYLSANRGSEHASTKSRLEGRKWLRLQSLRGLHGSELVKCGR